MHSNQVVRRSMTQELGILLAYEESNLVLKPKRAFSQRKTSSKRTVPVTNPPKSKGPAAVVETLDKKNSGAAPMHWLAQWEGIKGMRKIYPAAVDTMGCGVAIQKVPKHV